MKVLFTTRRYPPTTGGMERFAYDLSESLKSKASVSLVKWGGKSKLTLPLVLPYLFMKSFLILLIRKIDIIHMQDGIMSVFGVILKLIFKKPMCAVIHGLDITFNNSIYQFVIPRALKKADIVVCISQAAADEVLLRGVSPDKVHVIPLGITDDLIMTDQSQARSFVRKKLGVEENTRLILSVGRLVERKGVDWFIQYVLPGIVAKYADVIFVVTGEGEHRTIIEKTISEVNMHDHVRLLGRVDDKYLRNLYNGADVFVMPNVPVKGDMEGFGRVLLEASLCRLPVVASGIEGIKDAIIDNKNGFLVPAKDELIYKSIIIKLFSDSDYSKKFGESSRKYTLEHYGWSSVSDRYIELYKEKLGQK